MRIMPVTAGADELPQERGPMSEDDDEDEAAATSTQTGMYVCAAHALGHNLAVGSFLREKEN